jgi:hypothetical protein
MHILFIIFNQNNIKSILKVAAKHVILPEVRSTIISYNICNFFPSWLNYRERKEKKKTIYTSHFPQNVVTVVTQLFYNDFMSLLCRYKGIALLNAVIHCIITTLCGNKSVENVTTKKLLIQKLSKNIIKRAFIHPP